MTLSEAVGHLQKEALIRIPPAHELIPFDMLMSLFKRHRNI